MDDAELKDPTSGPTLDLHSLGRLRHLSKPLRTSALHFHIVHTMGMAGMSDRSPLESLASEIRPLTLRPHLHCLQVLQL